MKISRSAARQFTGLCRSSLTRGLEARMATMATIYGKLKRYRLFPLNHVIYPLHMALRRLNLLTQQNLNVRNVSTINRHNSKGNGQFYHTSFRIVKL